MTDDIWNLTPQQASERLAAMSLQPPPVDLAAPAPNLAAMSPAAARQRLDGLMKNPEWQRRFLDGSGPQMRDYNELTAKAAGTGDARLDAALARDADQKAPLFETTYDGEMNSWQTAAVIRHWRELGVPDDIIRENLSKTPTPIPRATHDAVARLERQRLSDPEWVKRWRAKGPVEWEEYAAIKTALDKPIAEDTAA